ncbi:MAG: hypothetical protein GVY04_10435 [Cyanobacteria bacterium]|jgi:Ca2+-binding RTX toxin-like protein|nr:hypothetical protein [Cyanobacteria bacterium GSL.Bin1]
MVEPNLLSVALLTPASDPVFGDPNAIIDLIFARAGSDAINGYDPGSNDGTRVDIDFLIGDLFDNTPEEFELILTIASGNTFAILDADIPSVGADRYVLGEVFQPYYSNFDPLSLITDDFFGFNQFAVIYDFAPEQDTIQLNGKKDDYLLLEVNNLAIPDIGTFSGELIFSLQQGIPDLVGLVVSKPEVDLALDKDYFQFVGNKPEDKPEEKKIGQLSTTGIDNGNGIAVDANGNIYITGSTSGSLFGTNQGFGDAWVTKYDINANQVWGQQIGTATSDVAYRVVTDASGHFYLAGSTGANLVGKDDPNASSEAWVAKYNQNGNQIWGKQFSLDGAFSTSGFGLQVDNDGNVYLSGLGIKENQNTEIFDFTVEDDAWLTKFDSQGNQQWTTVLDTLFFNENYDLAVDDEGNSYFVGWTQGLIDFGAFGGTGNPAFPQQEADPSRSLLKYDAWLTKVNPDGSIAWIQQFGSPDEGLEFAWSVDTDSQGDIYVSGWTTGALGTLDKEFEKAEKRDLFLAKFDQDAGDLVWSKQIGSEGDDGAFLSDLVIDDQNKIYLTAYTNDELGDGSSDEAFNALVGKFDTLGNNEWLRQFGVDDKYDYATGIDVSGDKVFVTGYSEGYLGLNGAEASGGAGDAWIAQLKAKDGKLTEFVGNDAESVVVESDITLPIENLNLVTNEALPVGDGLIQTTEGSSTGLNVVDYGEIGLGLGGAFDPSADNSVQTALLEALNDPSVFGSDIPGLKLEGSDDVDDILMGLVGDDEIKGKKGNDTLYGRAGDDKLEGEDGDDTLYGGGGADELKGGNGNDRFIIETATEAEFDVFDGEGEELERDPQGDTIVNASGGDVTFKEFDDIETFDGSGHAILGNADKNSFDFKDITLVNVSYVDGGAGEDEIKGGIGNETFRGGADKDKLEGKEGNDSLFGDAGPDDIKGGKGNDTLDGGAGNDKLNGEEGNDTLTGGAGNDELDGNKGDDVLIGVKPEANDPGAGEFDKLKGGDQSDTFVLGDSSQAYYVGNGISDYALVDDFELDESDKIQLHGNPDDYSLGIDLPDLEKGTAIFLGSNQNDLIGIVKDVKDIMLTDTSIFNFA